MAERWLSSILGRRTAVLLALAAMPTLSSGQPRAPSFRGLGVLPGGTNSTATAVSCTGAVVVGSSNDAASQGQVAFRWTEAEGMQSLGRFDGGTSSFAYGVSGDGRIVVGYGDGTFHPAGRRGFRWTQATGLVSLSVRSGGATESIARGISLDGEYIVGDSGYGVRWRGGEIDYSIRTDLFQFLAASEDCHFMATSDGTPIRMDTASHLDFLGTLPGTHDGTATAMSRDGSVLVGKCQSPGPPRAFWWTPSAGLVDIGLLPGADFSFAYGVSGDGTTVVGGSGAPGVEDPFIWTAAAGMRPLVDVLTERGITDHIGWRLQRATAISSDGTTIVGFGSSPEGVQQAWVAVIGSCPANLNGDCHVDFSDYLEFLNLYDSEDPRADFNADGLVDFADYLDFLNHYDAGC